MKIKITSGLLLLLFLAVLATTGCSAGGSNKSAASQPAQAGPEQNIENPGGSNQKETNPVPGQGKGLESKYTVKELSAQELAEMMEAKRDVAIIDMSTPGEYKEGHIAGSIHAEANLLRKQPKEYLASLKIEQDRAIVLVCETGNKSYNTVPYLLESGYREVYNLRGGKVAWLRSGFNLAKD